MHSIAPSQVAFMSPILAHHKKIVIISECIVLRSEQKQTQVVWKNGLGISQIMKRLELKGVCINIKKE